MPRPDFPRTIVEFQRRFPDEDACRAYLSVSRWPEGFTCPWCGGARAGEQPKRSLWECRSCGHQTSVTAGTVMHGTRTPLQLWFWAAYLVATHHPGISAVQLKRQLGIGRYDTAWLLLHKLRRAMVAPERDPLTGPVEVDDFYVGGIEEGRGGGRKSDGVPPVFRTPDHLRRNGAKGWCLCRRPDPRIPTSFVVRRSSCCAPAARPGSCLRASASRSRRCATGAGRPNSIATSVTMA